MLITLILTAATFGPQMAVAQEQSKPPKPPQPPKIAGPKAPEPKVKVAPVPEPPAQAAEGTIEPVTMKLAQGSKVIISTRMARVIVKGWDRDTLLASAKSEESPEPLEAKVAGEAPQQKVMLFIPSNRMRRMPGEITIDVKLPRYVELESVESGIGDIEVNDVEGRAVISSGTGEVAVNKVGPLKVLSRGGTITVAGVKGDLVVRSYRGEVMVNGVSGKVDLESSSGDVSVRNADGDVRVNSAVGKVDLRCVKGRAEVSTASGEITLTGMDGDVEASTANGDITFLGRIHEKGRYSLRTISGEIEMSIQADAPGFTAEMKTYSGELETAFPLKVEGPTQQPPVNRYIKGTYKNGSAFVSLDSFGGAVRLIKAAPAQLKECK